MTLVIREKNEFETAVVGLNKLTVRRSADAQPTYTGHISRAGVVIRVLTPQEAEAVFKENYQE